MLQQVADLREEGRELRALLETLPEKDWERPTLFKGWTVNDVVQHLHLGDMMGAASASDPAAYDALRADVQASRDSGLSRIEDQRRRLGHLTGRRLMERWHEELERLCELLEARDPGDRLKWVGPDMSVKMFATARQMEVWAHGQEVWDLTGHTRTATDRLKNIAFLGVRTYGWTFANRGLPEPGPAPRVCLTAPSGAVWEWNEAPGESAVEGDAVEFCQVVTQVRNVADTNLRVTGEPARRWMAIAQCFAGPPEDPPAPGARYTARGA